MRISQFGLTYGWHTTHALCLPCGKAITDMLMEVKREYR